MHKVLAIVAGLTTAVLFVSFMSQITGGPSMFDAAVTRTRRPPRAQRVRGSPPPRTAECTHTCGVRRSKEELSFTGTLPIQKIVARLRDECANRSYTPDCPEGCRACPDASSNLIIDPAKNCIYAQEDRDTPFTWTCTGDCERAVSCQK